ncbi:Nramp family divalent metal transporter [Hymenobacter properus]|uniref:Divalent metal cation transporter MntH n=1 Tax=Hymenobacter properus TaxID=2791026 RepID=A0A931FLT5_9BACT|nr:Nramp family divalent metal transporter [Hymenobacter properus]MBF9143220.1 Nramp family divalent metal transporter [Hymenobacter properus]MBR7722029.1 Nramp family divalent metal transporter [Microvirga sp. SRT04]
MPPSTLTETPPQAETGWRHPRRSNSLSEVYASIRVPGANASFWRKLFAFWGPGLMVAVGYMDPGNWATDLAGGSKYGYTLLSVVLISNLFAMLLQHLAAKLGIVTGRDLAQACRDHYSRPISLMLWFLCEIAIAACDLAEVIGSAIALNLLFGLPLAWGVVLTTLDVLVVLFFQNKGFRIIESIVAGLMVLIFGCFVYELIVSRPDWVALAHGLVPQRAVVTTPGMLYVAIGILGATVMPHNLYLHSSIVQTRQIEQTEAGKRMAIKFATIDSTVALFLAFFINAAILVLAAAAFHHNGMLEVAKIQDAYKLLAPVLGAGAASVLFAVALLASGQNSTLTGTLAGQIVMEGFLDFKLRPWVRRLITRLVAVVPALVVALIYGESGTEKLLVFSQVILSMQLSFAVVPLVLFTSSRAKMGVFVNRPIVRVLAWSVSAVIIALNGYLLWETALGEG